MKYLIVFSLLFLPRMAHSQATALLLKKNGKTIQRYYPGQYFEFKTTDGMPVGGRLDLVIRDSLFLTYHQIMQVPTQFGTLRFDTTGTFKLSFSMANIGSLPRQNKKGGFGLLSGALILGGLGFTTVNLVNTLREGDPPFGQENRGRILAGIGAATAGYLLTRTGSDTYTLGNKYKLEVVE